MAPPITEVADIQLQLTIQEVVREGIGESEIEKLVQE